MGVFDSLAYLTVLLTDLLYMAITLVFKLSYLKEWDFEIVFGGTCLPHNGLSILCLTERKELCLLELHL